MISYRPLWKLMKEKHVTTYTLRNIHHFSHSTVQRLQKDMPVTTYTLNRLCCILNCKIEDIVQYTYDPDDYG